MLHREHRIAKDSNFSRQAIKQKFLKFSNYVMEKIGWQKNDLL